MALTRSEVLSISKLFMGQIPYSQSKLWSDGYRTDCSGYISRCWKTPRNESEYAGIGTKGGTWGGYSTETFVTHGIMVPIGWGELQPGDAIGKCGPGTAGNGGHIALWLGKEGTRHRIRDHGSGMGPIERVIDPPDSYGAFRFAGFATPETKIPKPDNFPLESGHYFGHMDGPDVSHGGYNVVDKPFIRLIQTRLNELGFNAGIVDGEIGDTTVSAIRAFQSSVGITVDGQVGPETWRKLFSAVTPAPTTPDIESPEPGHVIEISDIARLLVPIESKLADLLSRPPVVAQIDTSSLADILADFFDELENAEITPDVIKEAVKQAFRDVFVERPTN